jgi:hypothetical protein
MLRCLTFADWAAGLAGALGLLAAFLPWYSYSSGSARITVNGFRASLLGDIFFLGIAALGFLMLIRQGVIQDPAGLKQREPTWLLATAAVMGTVVLLQLVLIGTGGLSVRAGFGIAVVAVIALGVSVRARFLSRPFFRAGSATTDRELPD